MNKILTNKLNFIVIHFISFVIIFSLFYLCKFVESFPNINDLLSWDAAYYFDIAKNGYQNPYSDNHNTAFFPLFSFVIYLFKLNPMHASIFNLLLFYTTLYIVFSYYKVELEHKLFIVSFPSFIFCLIPYTESLFLFFSTIFLIGFDKKKTWYVVIGVLFASITRTSALVFIPAFLFLLIIDLIIKRADYLKIYIYAIISSILGSIIVYTIQYIQTGVLFANFKVMKNWDRIISIPSFKLTTWGELNLLWIDSYAYLYFIFSICILLYVISKLIKKDYSFVKSINNSLLYAFAYIVLIGATVLLYSPKAYEKYTTIFGLNRYVFCTAFFVFALISILNKSDLFKNIYRYIFSLGLILFFIQFYRFESFYFLGGIIEKYSLKYYIYLFMSMIYFSIPFFYKYYKKQYSLPFILNIILQVYLYSLYINKEWVG